MKPDLIKFDLKIPFLGSIDLPSYFTALVIGFGFAIFLVWRWARKTSIPGESIIELGALMIISGVLGARIMSVIADGHFFDYINLCIDPLKVDWPISKSACMSDRYKGIWDPVIRMCHPDYRDCFSWLKFWRGGLAFYGGLILSTVAGIVFIILRKLPLAKIMDSAAWAIPLGLGWGRLGCFFNGCCFGSVTNSSFGVVFPPGSQASIFQARAGLIESINMPSLPVIPTQLIESFIAFSIAFICYHYVQKYKRFSGETFICFIIMYGTGRFIEEIWRRDERGELLGLSSSQIIALVTIVIAIIIYSVFLLRLSQKGSNKKYFK